MNSIGEAVARLVMRICSIFPLQDKIVFTAYAGSVYGDSPRMIYEEMVRKHKDKYKYIWIMSDKNVKIENAYVVKKRTFLSLYHMATAKMWVDNARKSHAFIKRKGQYYVQTWHGNIALKKVEKDAVDKLPVGYVKNAKHDSQIADLFLSGSNWLTKKYREAFWYTGEVLEYGLPRADILYKEPSEYIKKVYNYYDLDSNVKLVLYAPTFRIDKSTECYSMDYKRLLETLKELWGGEWKILVRLHPNIQGKQKDIFYDEDVLNGSLYGEIGELIMAIDLLVTDYSSCMFDAMEAGKRVLLYATDIEDYMQDRGTYFSLFELPFLIAENNEELQSRIMEYDDASYCKKVNRFMKQCGFFNCADSTEKIVDYIMNKIN